MSFSEDNVQESVRKGVALMRARRRAEEKLAEAAREYPELAAREMLVFARTEGDRVRQELLEHFGFFVSPERSGFPCRLAGAPPQRFENRK